MEDNQPPEDDHAESTEQTTPSTVSPSEKDHVTMSVTVPVDDMDEESKAAVAALSDIYESNFREVVAKNRDYGWSFLRTGTKLVQTEATPFDQPARAQLDGLLHRTGDKRERLLENVFGDSDASVSDPPSTTAAECANYYFFMSFVLANPEIASSFVDS